MESAYFVPDALTRESLIDAHKRGASVEIIVPGAKIDTKIVRRASRARWGDLLKEGVKIYEYQPTMFHCKLMIIDGVWVSLGSSIMDNRSFRLNDEANLNVLDAKFGAEQVRMFEEDKAAAREVTFEMWQRRPFREKVAEHLASLLGWEL
jgi:cardiolipin synthase